MKRNIYVISQDPKFFFRLNKELKKLKIPFKILNLGQRIPNVDSIVLTTLQEIFKIKKYNENKVNIIPYKSGENFEKYILEILKVYQCGNSTPEQIMFSIDPGKSLGLVVFFNGYFLYSETLFKEESLIAHINNFIKYLELDEKKKIKLIFKFGRGVLPLTLKLISIIYSIFREKFNLSIYLINEAKTSKIKFHKLSDEISKHEASAFLLALRKGIKVNKENYKKFVELIKSDRRFQQELEKEIQDIKFLNRNINFVKSLFLELLNCKITINEAYNLINKKRVIKEII
ncbi:MAG: hypothetical protein GF317_15545 [Candidatus Lokiarchaeota archaeon]|nr:hypothetical protein [Candidatus Lokiarchaeota archaeon]MBD3200977.1 hypothetical protein [Candidatus Lokiarchaeota archaeon]